MFSLPRKFELTFFGTFASETRQNFSVYIENLKLENFSISVVALFLCRIEFSTWIRWLFESETMTRLVFETAM